MASRGKYMVQLALLKRQAKRENSKSNKLSCPTEVQSVRANISKNVGEDISNRDIIDKVKQSMSTEVMSGQTNIRMDCEVRKDRDESDVGYTNDTLPTSLSEFVCEFSPYSADNEPINFPNDLDTEELQFSKTIIDKDENNNDTGQRSLSVSNSVNEARLLCCESELSDDSTDSYDDDDDVRDPSWKPTKKDLVVSETESEEEEESDNKGNSNTEINILDRQSSLQINPIDNLGRYIDEGTEGDKPEDTIDHEEVVESAECSRKRQRTADPQNWKRNVQKRLRMEGKEFLGIKKSSSGEYIVRNRSSRILTERGCSKRCKKSSKNRQCTLISEKDRQCIFDGFWNNLDWQGKKVLVNSLVDCKPCPDSDNKRRKVSYIYHLKSGGIKVQVCKSMFLSTLGIGEKMAYGWLEDAEQNSGTPNKPKKLSRGREFATIKTV